MDLKVSRGPREKEQGAHEAEAPGETNGALEEESEVTRTKLKG